MKGFETQNVVSDSVDNWTIQQCEEHLRKYPKGFIADQARVRLKKLQPQTSNKGTKPIAKEKQIPSTPTSTRNLEGTVHHPRNNKNGNKATIILLKILVTIICLGLVCLIGFAISQHIAFISTAPLCYFLSKWLIKFWKDEL